MSEQKTKPTKVSVDKFLKSVADEKRRKDCYAVLELMKNVTKEKPKVWGTAIVGFGSYHYKYPSGHEGDCFVTGFAPRKQALTIYIMPGLNSFSHLLKKMGKFKTGVGCLYVKSLDDIDLSVLKELIKESVKYIKTNIKK